MEDFWNKPTNDWLREDPDGFEPMTTFDKACAVIAIPIGVIFMVLGAIGLFTGSNANFTLPPILGGLPFFLGWAMSIPLIRYWKISVATLPWSISGPVGVHPVLRAFNTWWKCTTNIRTVVSVLFH